MNSQSFTQQYGIQYPIICAPMFLVSTVKLVVAVSEAGGIGSFPALNYRPVEKFREAVQHIKAQTSKPFAVNLIVQQNNKALDAQLDICISEKVPIIITSLGNPKKVIEQAHKVGSKVWCDVIDLHQAKKVEDLGADALVAVSYGAGGHAGFMSPFVLIPLLARNFKIPVIAAGGIVDQAGLRAAQELGASAAYMGTRFIASHECEVSDEYKKAIIQASAGDIINTDRVDGFPGNFIRTPKLEELGLKDSFLETILKTSPRFKRMWSLKRMLASLFHQEQKVSYKTVFAAGQGVGLIEEVLSVQEILRKTST